jgi:hypothetical protein
MLCFIQSKKWDTRHHIDDLGKELEDLRAENDGLYLDKESHPADVNAMICDIQQGHADP